MVIEKEAKRQQDEAQGNHGGHGSAGRGGKMNPKAARKTGGGSQGIQGETVTYVNEGMSDD